MIRIVFMGTPDFAAVMLKALVTSGSYEIAAAITQPDKPKGRGYALSESPVKQYAQQCGIPVLQPRSCKGEDFLEELDRLAPDMIVVAAYGKILPSAVIRYPRLGCINVHGSLLPAYRGAAPIQRAIINGESETGVTIMHMDEGIDTGDMLSKTVVPITDADTFGTLHDSLAQAGAELLLRTLPQIIDGTVTAEKQSEEGASYAHKIEKSDCSLDFDRPAREVFNRIRGLSPFPLAAAVCRQAVLKIPAAECSEEAGCHGKPGEVLSLDGGKLLIACGTGTVSVTEVLPAGKKRMSASDFINGRKVGVGDILSPLPFNEANMK